MATQQSDTSAAAAKKKKRQHRKPSAVKRARQNLKLRAHNHQRLSQLYTAVKKVRTSVKSGKKAEAEKALALAVPLLSKAGQKWLIHPKKASRLTSHLSADVSALK